MRRFLSSELEEHHGAGKFSSIPGSALTPSPEPRASFSNERRLQELARRRCGGISYARSRAVQVQYPLSDTVIRPCGRKQVEHTSSEKTSTRQIQNPQAPASHRAVSKSRPARRCGCRVDEVEVGALYGRLMIKRRVLMAMLFLWGGSVGVKGR